MPLSTIAMAILLIVSFGFFAYHARRLVSYMHLAGPIDRCDRKGDRIAGVISFVLGQKKLFKDPLPGLMHFTIFWGFIVLTIGTLELFAIGLHEGWSFAWLGPLYGPLFFVQDLLATLVALAIIYAVFRRLVLRPARLESLKADAKRDGLFILGLIFFLMITILTTRGAAITLGEPEGPGVAWQPFSKAVAPLFAGMPEGSLRVFYHLSWWLHVLLVLGFLCYLPFSKHLHIGAAVFNVYFRNLEPTGRLTKLDLEDESIETFGANQLADFTWRDVLDGYACTECGRCTELCPAQNTGKPLDPRKIVHDIRVYAMDRGKAMAAAGGTGNGNGEGGGENGDDPGIINTYTSTDEIWSCTTCGACVEACPVLIEHVQKIVDMRRHLVLMESAFPSEAEPALRGFETNSNPWGLPADQRMEWAEGLEVPLIADRPDAEYLYYVGCAASYDDRNKKVARALIKVLEAAGVSYAVLGTEETCNGECARRIGNEYLAQEMMMALVETLNGYHVKRIIAACPHCYNTLKNEYPQFGGHYEVIHHADFILGLIRDGRLQLAGKLDTDVAFHDSCYLGRYNGVYDSPRQTIQAVTGRAPIEGERVRDKSFCCGAGGGRMWMEEHGTKVNVDRVDELVRTGATTIGAACPFCMTMMTDGLKERGKDEEVQVKDLAELVAEALETPATAPE
jgi:Fe-S oxidoreductase